MDATSSSAKDVTSAGFGEYVEETKQPLLCSKFKVIIKFFGHGAFKYLGLEPGTIIDVNCLSYFGKNKRNIRDLIAANMLEETTSEPNMDINWLEEYVEKGKKQPAPVKEVDFKFQEAMQSFEFDFLKMAEEFYKIQPYFYDKTKLWWLWNFELTKWERTDDTDIMNKINSCLPSIPKTTNSKVKNEILESMERIGRLKIPKPAPDKWIQFKDKAFSLRSGNIYPVQPNYFFTNPIPWELSENSETPIMDKLFEEWVGKDNIQTLYEIIAYCCYRNYPIHLLFCLIGSGRNGKSCFQKLLCKFIGQTNVCSTELDDLLDSRFEKAKLYKKLVCSLGETNFNIISKTSLIKKLTGQDLIGYEFKGKDPFDDYNYAKILINSNSLPSSDDTSEGFYRRWMIINFENTFPEGKDIILTVKDEEFVNLSRKICQILPKLLEKGAFTNQGDIESRKHNYIINSNPLEVFLNHICNKEVNSYVLYSELYSLYCKFLSNLKKRTVSHKEFTNSLERAGIEIQKTSKKIKDEWVNGKFIIGYELKVNFVNVVNDVTNFTISLHIEKPVVKSCTSSTSSTNLSDLTQFCRDFGKHNIEKMIEKFGEKQVEKWLEDGTLIYIDSDTYLVG